MRAVLWGGAFSFLPLLGAVPKPADWVPARWPWTDAASLELLQATPVNCLLLKQYTPAFAAAAAERGIVTLALVTSVDEARAAIAAKLNGVVLEGDYSGDLAARVREVAPVVVELPPRSRMKLGDGAPIIGSFQGVWPGIQIQEDGAAKAGPTGSAWIDTNTGFIRAARAWGNATVWIANTPPPKTIVTGERYLQAIADAAMSGARWVLALDGDLAARLARRDPAAMKIWGRMGQELRFYEAHPEWRAMQPYGKLAVVQDPAAGGLLSGGILDMIAAKHTPVRPVPRQKLSPSALAGASMAVNVDAEALTAEQREILRAFARGGGTLLTGPPGWKDSGATGGRITLEKAELERLSDIWRDVQTMVGRRNLGVRLFNVSSMLSNLLATPDGKQVIVHLVNYSGYPVENVAVHFLGKYSRATLLSPEGVETKLEIYETEDGGGVDIDRVPVCAAVRLEQAP